MPGKAPVLKTKVKAMLRRQEALSLVGQGWPITKISEHMGTAVQSVRRLLRQALATESIFPSSLTPERVAELRVLEAERLAVSTQKVVVAQNNALRRLKADNPKVQADAETSIYRAHEALVRSSERLARLFGLDVPTESIQKVFSLQAKMIDQRVVVSFDPAQIKPDWSIDTGFRRGPPDEDLSGPPKLLDGTNGNGG